MCIANIDAMRLSFDREHGCSESLRQVTLSGEKVTDAKELILQLAASAIG